MTSEIHSREAVMRTFKEKHDSVETTLYAVLLRFYYALANR